MKQVIFTFLFTTLLSVVGTKAFAYDIAVENSDGVMIYYNYYNDGTELEVTRKSSSYRYSGVVNIPEEVTYMSRTRKVTTIGDGAFWDCSGLISVTIPNSVTTIGQEAFFCCTGLSSVTIPNSVTTIKNSAFNQCSGLTSVHITDLASWCKIAFNVERSNPLYYAHHLFLNDEEIKDLVIPNSVTTIKNYAFYRCSSLTSVTIPNSVTTIEERAFYGCTGLTSVTIPNSVKIIGASAFSECSRLTSVTIPNSVTTIGKEAFSGCTGLTSVTIPNSVKIIGASAFSVCI